MRALVLAIIILFAAGLSAQVYGGMSKSDIESWIAHRERAESAADKKEREAAAEKLRLKILKEKAAAEKARKEKAEKERAENIKNRAKNLNDLIDDADKRGKKIYTAFKKKYLTPIKKSKENEVELGFLSGKIMVATGQIKDARRDLKSLRSKAVPEETSNSLRTLRYKVVEAVRRGAHLEEYYRLDVLSKFSLDYDNWQSATKLKGKQAAANRSAKIASREILGLIPDQAGFVEKDVKAVSDNMVSWALDLTAEWKKIWYAKAKMHANPLDVQMTYEFANLIMRNEYCEENIVALVIFEDLIKNFPNDPLVKNGYCAIQVAYAYRQVMDFDAAVKALESVPAKSPRNVRKLARDELTATKKARMEFNESYTKN